MNVSSKDSIKMLCLKIIKSFRLAHLSAICFLLSAGCTGQEIKPTTPDGWLKQGNQMARDQQYRNAKDAYQKVLQDFPDSKERLQALLALGDSLYKAREYEEAKFNYRKFIELYPAHSKVDHAHFYKALADFKLIDTALRDQTFTHNALDEFEKIIKEFPKSQYHKLALAKKQECETILAESIMQIGKFYYRTGSYQSAILRLKKLLQTYPNQKFNDEAVFLIAESYYHEQNYNNARESYSHLLKQYPQSLFAKDAADRLKALR